MPEPAASSGAKRLLGLRVNPETPRSFMLRWRRRWVNKLDALDLSPARVCQQTSR